MAYDPVARDNAKTANTVSAQALAVAQDAQAMAQTLAWVEVNSNTVATDGQHLSVDTSVQPVTITLPAAGGTVALRDNAGTWGTNPVTVVGNGMTISGQATFALNLPGFAVTFTAMAGVWRYTLQFLNGAS
jgi:hypothetical protein